MSAARVLQELNRWRRNRANRELPTGTLDRTIALIEQQIEKLSAARDHTPRAVQEAMEAGDVPDWREARRKRDFDGWLERSQRAAVDLFKVLPEHTNPVTDCARCHNDP